MLTSSGAVASRCSCTPATASGSEQRTHTGWSRARLSSGSGAGGGAWWLAWSAQLDGIAGGTCCSAALACQRTPCSRMVVLRNSCSLWWKRKVWSRTYGCGRTHSSSPCTSSCRTLSTESWMVRRAMGSEASSLAGMLPGAGSGASAAAAASSRRTAPCCHAWNLIGMYTSSCGMSHSRWPWSTSASSAGVVSLCRALSARHSSREVTRERWPIGSSHVTVKACSVE
mmetsp:Transcript_13527/g.33682  ORF Transcript_13527/g.33682 Transcript_13527/m.33682 type:complete len:227 (-) Transcript_13527:203-883(-)